MKPATHLTSNGRTGPAWPAAFSFQECHQLDKGGEKGFAIYTYMWYMFLVGELVNKSCHYNTLVSNSWNTNCN